MESVLQIGMQGVEKTVGIGYPINVWKRDYFLANLSYLKLNIAPHLLGTMSRPPWCFLLAIWNLYGTGMVTTLYWFVVYHIGSKLHFEYFKDSFSIFVNTLFLDSTLHFLLLVHV